MNGMLSARSEVPYSGEYYTLSDAGKVVARVDAFVAWASVVNGLARREKPYIKQAEPGDLTDVVACRSQAVICAGGGRGSV